VGKKPKGKSQLNQLTQMKASTRTKTHILVTVTAAVIMLTGCLKAGASGRIIIAFDDWVLGDTAFSQAPDTGQLVTNVAAWFTHGQPGRFLCTASFSQDVNRKFAYAITNAGNTLTITNVPLDSLSLATWLTYDALFIGDASIDNGMLTNYVNAGGSVYLYGIGYGSEPAEWNTFLQPFGLAYGGTLPNLGVIAITNTVHPLFLGVTNVYYNNGEIVSVTTTADPRSQVLQFDPAGRGMFAVWDPTATNRPQLTISFTGLQLVGTAGTSNRIEYVSNLTDTVWTPLTNVFLTQSNYFLIDPDFPKSARRFYRAVQLP
jgi:hypothetical protein